MNQWHGSKSSTFTLENVTIEKGWVTTSSKRREWLFPQFDGDMSNEGVELYNRLNNLGACRDRA